MTRTDLFDARNVSDLIDRLESYLGRKPTASELRTWVNTVLGPWAITDEHRARLQGPTINITGRNTRTNKSVDWTMADHGLRNGQRLVESARGALYWFNPVRGTLTPEGASRKGPTLMDCRSY